MAHGLDAQCDCGDGDPLRWSPIVVELFMLDFLPRRAITNAAEIRSLPEGLRAWVRFALTKRGLEQQWIAETEEAVTRFALEFRRLATDHRRFGRLANQLPGAADGLNVAGMSYDPPLPGSGSGRPGRPDPCRHLAMLAPAGRRE